MSSRSHLLIIACCCFTELTAKTFPWQDVEGTCIGTVLAHLSDCFVAFSLRKGSSLLKLSGYSFGF